jgi:hypothetical protein
MLSARHHVTQGVGKKPPGPPKGTDRGPAMIVQPAIKQPGTVTTAAIARPLRACSLTGCRDREFLAIDACAACAAAVPSAITCAACVPSAAVAGSLAAVAAVVVLFMLECIAVSKMVLPRPDHDARILHLATDGPRVPGGAACRHPAVK